MKEFNVLKAAQLIKEKLGGKAVLSIRVDTQNDVVITITALVDGNLFEAGYVCGPHEVNFGNIDFLTLRFDQCLNSILKKIEVAKTVCPNCRKKSVMGALGGGIRCTDKDCSYWFCF